MSADATPDDAVVNAVKLAIHTVDRKGLFSINDLGPRGHAWYESLAVAAIRAVDEARAAGIREAVENLRDAAFEYGQETIIADQPWATSGAESDAQHRTSDARANLLRRVGIVEGVETT